MDNEKEPKLEDAITNYVGSMTREQLEAYVAEDKTNFFFESEFDITSDEIDDFIAENSGSKFDLTSKKEEVLKLISEGTILLTTDQITTMQDTLEEAMNLMSGITTPKELMSLISSTTFASGDEKELNRQKVVELLNALRLEDSSTTQVSSVSERKHENILDKLSHLDKFETPGSLERQIVVENALYEYIENNNFNFSDISGNHDDGWMFLKYDSSHLRIHGRDLDAKVLGEAIDTYMAKNNILDQHLTDYVKYIREQYGHYKSLFSSDDGYSESHKVQLNIDKNTDLAYNFLLSDVATKNVISDLGSDTSAPQKLMTLLQENNRFSTAQIKYAGSELIESITDFLNDKGLSEDDVCKSIAENFYITHSKHFNPTNCNTTTKVLKP